MQSSMSIYKIFHPSQTEALNKSKDAMNSTKAYVPFSSQGLQRNSRGKVEGMFLKCGLIWLMRLDPSANQSGIPRRDTAERKRAGRKRKRNEELARGMERKWDEALEGESKGKWEGVRI